MIFEGRNRVTSGFRLAARPNHNGIDIVGDDDKTVHAVAGGAVTNLLCKIFGSYDYSYKIDPKYLFPPVLTSPNGTQYRLVVSDAGVVTATAIV